MLSKGIYPRNLNYKVSSSCGSFNTASAAYVDITNLSVTITTSGNPVYVFMESAGTNSRVDSRAAGANSYPGFIMQFLRGATQVAEIWLHGFCLALNDDNQHDASIVAFDEVSAGTYTYKAQVKTDGISNLVRVWNYRLVAYEFPIIKV